MKIVALIGFHTFPREFVDLLPDDEVVVLLPGDSLEAARGAVAAVGGPDSERIDELLSVAPTVRWFQSLSAGVEGLNASHLADRGVVLTNNSGAYDVPIAEHAMAMILAAAKRLPVSFAAQQRHEWHGNPESSDVRGSTMVILGMGSIGGELAKLARSVGMKVIGIRRSGADGALPPERLADAVAEADYLAVCAALTPTTRGMVSAEVIARMKPSAWLVNISRGAIVDEKALLDACTQGRIGGVAMDAWWEEPLPNDSPWWDMPNVIVTPHTSYSSPLVRIRSRELVVENVRRFKAGEQLLNVVDPALGY